MISIRSNYRQFLLILAFVSLAFDIIRSINYFVIIINYLPINNIWDGIHYVATYLVQRYYVTVILFVLLFKKNPSMIVYYVLSLAMLVALAINLYHPVAMTFAILILTGINLFLVDNPQKKKTYGLVLSLLMCIPIILSISVLNALIATFTWTNLMIALGTIVFFTMAVAITFIPSNLVPNTSENSYQ